MGSQWVAVGPRAPFEYDRIHEYEYEYADFTVFILMHEYEYRGISVFILMRKLHVNIHVI